MAEYARLIHVTTIPGTIRAFLLPYAQAFRSRGWVVDCMAAGAPACPVLCENFDRVWDVSWSRNPLDLANFGRTPRLIEEIVKRERYDIVHVHTPVAAFVTRYALRNLRQEHHPKVVYTAHGFHFYRGGSVSKNTVFRMIERLAGRWTDHLIVMNREDHEAAQALKIVPPSAVTFMSGIGIATSEYDPSSVRPEEIASVRAEMGLNPSSPLFLMVAEFIPRKRHVDALQAFANLMFPEAHLAFAGDGPCMREMKRLARTLGVSDCVHFLGLRNDIRILMRASNALLLPSTQEGLPRSIMEALSLQVPVIGSDIRGTRDLLENGCGLLVPVGDVGGLARAIQCILDNPSEARVMAQRWRAKMITKCDINHILKSHTELYDLLLNDGLSAYEEQSAPQ